MKDDQIYEEFRNMDLNHNGIIEADELRQSLLAAAPGSAAAAKRPKRPKRPKRLPVWLAKVSRLFSRGNEFLSSRAVKLCMSVTELEEFPRATDGRVSGLCEELYLECVLTVHTFGQRRKKAWLRWIAERDSLRFAYFLDDQSQLMRDVGHQFRDCKGSS
ncbi:unnamed protein product [Cladocopium goreaui]|uniref:EF-hand domain-containing protein n=1 Tax=Cladocopium goreaui TaxID=2562237 RepID=A0A9P1GQ16_9DINO|nr:unnamed protein product [Cladocopium goreaui]